jgi:AcrR family transcriptional regulator
MTAALVETSMEGTVTSSVPRSRRRGSVRVVAGMQGRPRGGELRERLLRAVVSLVAANGYARTRVSEVARAARVQHGVLYANFDGLGDALLTACDRWLEQLLDQVERAVVCEQDWRAGVREGLRWLLLRGAGEREIARCCFLELCALGTPGEECRLRVLERLAVALSPVAREGRARGAPTVFEELAVGGIWHGVQAGLVSEGSERLPSLLPVLHRHVVACAGVDLGARVNGGATGVQASSRPGAGRRALSARDREIVALRALGWTLRELAARFGVSHQRIAQIVGPGDRELRVRAVGGAAGGLTCMAFAPSGNAAGRDNRADPAQRRGAVRILVEGGLTAQQIAGSLGCSLTAVYRDLAWIRAADRAEPLRR